MFKNKAGTILYVGQSSNLKERLKSYTQTSSLGKKTRFLISQTEQVKTISVSSPLEAILLEAQLIRQHRPKYNLRGKDDKGFLSIKIDQSPVPVLSLGREIKDETASYFGPFPRAWLTRQLLRNLRYLFPYCTCKKGFKENCLYRQLNLCASPAPGSSGKPYQKMIKSLTRFLRGNVSSYLDQLEKKMAKAAKREDYERAAAIRDQIRHLDSLNLRLSRPRDYLKDPNLAADIAQEETDDLKKLLNSAGLNIDQLSRIEAYDISHFAGQGAVGSMVVFENAVPRRGHYRRFKIRSDQTKNDLKMVAEVMARRFQRITGDDRSFSSPPDMVLIDGGVGQVKAALKALSQLSLSLNVVGIEKRWETLVVPGDNRGQMKKIHLKSQTRARSLVQKIRDEAHRFAFNYHRLLRKKLLLGQE